MPLTGFYLLLKQALSSTLYKIKMVELYGKLYKLVGGDPANNQLSVEGDRDPPCPDKRITVGLGYLTYSHLRYLLHEFLT